MSQFRVYIAGRFSRQAELLGYADDLEEEYGIGCTSRWLTGEHGFPDDDDGFSQSDLIRFAAEDLADIRAADVFMLFTEHPDIGYTSAGRMVEYGYALAHGKLIVIVGPTAENIFCIEPMRYRDFEDAASYLAFHAAPDPDTTGGVSHHE